MSNDENQNEKTDTDKDENISISELQTNIDIKWSHQHEKILIDWADKAMCYRWLHAKANRKYYKLNAMFTIPVIIISTLTGTANFAQDKFADDQREYAVMAIGSMNILAGIVTTIQQFLKIAELNEAHRVSCVAWDKFFRNIKVELAKHPDERIPVKGMMKWAKEEFDRLIETNLVNMVNNIQVQFHNIDNNSTSHMIKIREALAHTHAPTYQYEFVWENWELKKDLR